MQLIDYAAGLKLDTIQISSLGDYYVARAGASAERAGACGAGGYASGRGDGVHLSRCRSRSMARRGTAEQQILTGLRVAKAVGANSMRCFMGSDQDRQTPDQLARCMEATIRVFRAVKAQAQDLGVKIALENHAGDMQAREVRTIIEESGKETYRELLGYGESDVGDGKSVGDAGCAGAVCSDNACARFGGVRGAEWGGGTVGGVG